MASAMYLLLLFVAVAAAAPPTNKVLVVDSKYFSDAFAIYTAEHDVVEITIPLNDLNFPDNDETSKEHINYFFFIEADLKPDGSKDYKGAYVFRNGGAVKILENGQSVTYGKDYQIYIGASDGIYTFNHSDRTFQKFGGVTDNVIKMGIDTDHAVLYYLTSDYVLYNIDLDGTKHTKVEAVKDARDFVFDFDGNLFFYDGAKKFYVYDGSKVVEIEGLPTGKKVALINPPILINEVYAVVDGMLYEITPKGHSETEGVKLEVPVTAFAPDTVVLQYYAYNKKIYEYNLVSLIENMDYEDLQDFFGDKKEEIKTIAKSKPKKKV